MLTPTTLPIVNFLKENVGIKFTVPEINQKLGGILSLVTLYTYLPKLEEEYIEIKSEEIKRKGYRITKIYWWEE